MGIVGSMLKKMIDSQVMDENKRKIRQSKLLPLPENLSAKIKMKGTLVTLVPSYTRLFLDIK